MNWIPLQSIHIEHPTVQLVHINGAADLQPHNRCFTFMINCFLGERETTLNFWHYRIAAERAKI